ncbi:flagellar protein FlaG [Paenibacillus provencensis]|uniref:Flagellar protein FlaG n=1 Tax=Paenibacillus provencensis TaxID=441151 RepID=A0ABW3Q3S1_9BACL|nr:flagellar protein FlaG [Paenibacillus sp. MER 78]MCM3128289.1 flagellar protein FlaG [Paenibacillus sp. MER 78]
MDNRISSNGHSLNSIKPSGNQSSNQEEATRRGTRIGQSISELSKEQKIEIEQLEKAIRAIQGPEKKFEFSVHKETSTIMVKVFDKSTGDLIREIPREKLLDIAARMIDINGLLIDEKA